MAATNTAYAAILARLNKQAQGDFGLGDPTKVSIPQPDAVSYGAFGQQLASAEAQLAQDPAFGGGYLGALRNASEQENRDYDRRLAAAQAAQLQGQQFAAKYGIKKAIIDNTPEGQWRNGLFDENTGSIDPVLGMATNAITNAGQIADAHKTAAEATGELYKAGVKPDLEDVNAGQGNPIFGTPAKYGAFAGGINPGDQAAITNAQAAETNAGTNAFNAQTNAREVGYKEQGGMYTNPDAAGAGAYNTVLGNGKFGNSPAPLTQMTLGQVMDFGRSTLIPNSKKAGIGRDSRGLLGSSAVGAYQITGETLARIAPQVLGPDWQSQTFSPDVQDALGKAIYEDAQSRGVPLNKVWASLSPATAASLAGKPWEQVRNTIIAGETGGGGKYGAFPRVKGSFTTPDPNNPNGKLTFNTKQDYDNYVHSQAAADPPWKGRWEAKGYKITPTPGGNFVVIDPNGNQIVVDAAGLKVSGKNLPNVPTRTVTR